MSGVTCGCDPFLGVGRAPALRTRRRFQRPTDPSSTRTDQAEPLRARDRGRGWPTLRTTHQALFRAGVDALWRYVVAFGIIALGAVVLAVLVGVIVEGVVRLLVAGL